MLFFIKSASHNTFFTVCVLFIIASMFQVVVSFNCQGDEYIRVDSYLVCKKIVNCRPGNEILPCQRPCEPLRCMKCRNGFVQPHLIHWDTRQQKCFKKHSQYSCIANDIIPRRPDSRDPLITSCPKASACSCNLDNCFYGDDPCVCNRQFRRCAANMTLHKNGTCVPCPPRHYKDHVGCGACMRLPISSLTPTTPKVLTPKTTSRPNSIPVSQTNLNVQTTKQEVTDNKTVSTEKKDPTTRSPKPKTSSLNRRSGDDSNTEIKQLTAPHSQQEKGGNTLAWVYIVIVIGVIVTVVITIAIIVQRKYHMFTECRQRGDEEEGLNEQNNWEDGQHGNGIPMAHVNNINVANGHLPNNNQHRNPNVYDRDNDNMNGEEETPLIDPNDNIGARESVNEGGNDRGAGDHNVGSNSLDAMGAVGGNDNDAAKNEKNGDKSANCRLGEVLEIKNSVISANRGNVSNPSSPNHSDTSEMGSPVLSPTDSQSLLLTGQGHIPGEGHPAYCATGTSRPPGAGRQESKTENNKPVTCPSDDSDTCPSSPNSLEDQVNVAKHKTYTSKGTESLPSAAEDVNYRSKSLKPGENEEDTEPKVRVDKNMEDSGIDTSR